MIRIFETGDLHIGRTYSNKNKHPEGRELAKKRLDAVLSMVETANVEKCDLFVVTGDLFDKTNGVAKKDIRGVVDMLAGFRGIVLVLPGNHDYFPADFIPDVWNTFLDASEDKENILLLKQFEPYELTVGDEKIVLYPAYCQIDTSPENNLGWIKEQEISKDGIYRIGIAHGAVAGHTIDTEGEYFLMTEEELKAIPVDIWLIGHTHVMFPDDITFGYKSVGTIFNAGTHVQTDVRNNTEGNCFIIEIEKTLDGKATVRAKRYISGDIFFKRCELHIEPNGSGTELKDAIENAISKLDSNTSVSLKISGTVCREEYENREDIYASTLSRFFEHPHPIDKDLIELISEEFIRSEFSELTFPAKLLMQLVNDPKKAQMAYDLLKSKECQA